MKKYQLREQAHISSNSVAKLSKGEFVSMEVLLKICETLDYCYSQLACCMRWRIFFDSYSYK